MTSSICFSSFNSILWGKFADLIREINLLRSKEFIGLSLGELVKLFVVKKNPNLTKNDIYNHCRKNLSAYKVPKEIEFKDELPKTNVGKILRRALREE